MPDALLPEWRIETVFKDGRVVTFTTRLPASYLSSIPMRDVSQYCVTRVTKEDEQ